MEAQWSLILFTVISGAGAWLFAASTCQALAKKGALPGKVTSIVAVVLLALGGLASMTHLKHVDRIFEALNHPTSGIFVEAALIGVLIVLIAVYFAMVVRRSSKTALKVVAIVVSVVGIVFTFACGMSYMMEARQAWMTYALPLSYCLTAGAAGVALNQLLQALGIDAPKGAGDEASDKEAGAEGAVAFSGMLTLVVSVLALIAAAVFAIHAAGWLDKAAAGAALWLAVTFVSGVVAVAAGVWAWRKPAAGKAAGVVAVIAGVLFAVAVRVFMWLVGTPLMDLFLMPME